MYIDNKLLKKLKKSVSTFYDTELFYNNRRNSYLIDLLNLLEIIIGETN